MHWGKHLIHKIPSVRQTKKYRVLNPSKTVLALKKVSPRILSTFKRSFSKKKWKTPSSHIIHSLGGEYCWIVRDSEPIRLLKSPRSLSVYILILHITRKQNRPVTVLEFVKKIFPLSIKLAYLHLYSVSVFITLTCFRLRRYAYSSGHDSNSSCHSLSGILAILA